VQAALIAENIEAPGGRIVRGPAEVGVRTLGRVKSVDEFGAIVIKNVNGSPIRLRDVGYAEDGMAERRTFSYYQGVPSVTLDVRRQIGQNTVKVVEDVQKRVESLKKSLPPGVTTESMEAFFDNWVYSTGIPVLRVRYSVKGKAPSWKVSGTVEQSAVNENFSVDVPVEIQFAKGATQTVWVRTSSEPASFSATLKQPPTKVEIRTGVSVLAARK